MSYPYTHAIILSIFLLMIIKRINKKIFVISRVLNNYLLTLFSIRKHPTHLIISARNAHYVKSVQNARDRVTVRYEKGRQFRRPLQFVIQNERSFIQA